MSAALFAPGTFSFKQLGEEGLRCQQQPKETKRGGKASKDGSTPP